MKTDKRLKLEKAIENLLDEFSDDPESYIPDDAVEKLADGFELVYDSWVSLEDYFRDQDMIN